MLNRIPGEEMNSTTVKDGQVISVEFTLRVDGKVIELLFRGRTAGVSARRRKHHPRSGA